MKALSLSRPWPWTILHCGKRIENRSRKDGRMPYMCKHRGPLLLHAAKSWDKGAAAWLMDRGLVVNMGDRDNRYHPPGIIVARCVVIGHIDPTEKTGANPLGHRIVIGDPDPRTTGRAGVHSTGGYSCSTREEYAHARALDLRWWMGDHALILDKVEAVHPVPCKGALGLWTPPDNVLEQVRAVRQ